MSRISPAQSPDEPPLLVALPAGHPPFHLWHLPERGMPWACLLTLIASAVATLLAFFAEKPVFNVLYATGAQVWLAGKWHGLLGSVLLHGGLLHFIFNACWVWIFGRELEDRLGPIRFLLLLWGTAWVSGVAELAWSGNPGIGLSGAVYGLFGFLWVRRHDHAAFAAVVPRGVIRLFCIWLFVCIALTALDLYPVANAAHFAGLAAGLVAGWAVQSRFRRLAQAGAASLLACSVVLLFWAPWQESWIAARAARAVDARDNVTALRWLEKIPAGSAYADWAKRAREHMIHLRAVQAKTRAELLALADQSRDANVLNTIAWRLATSPNDEIRDSAEAVVQARRACAADGFETSAYLDTLAAAHAEAGNFSAAEMWSLRSLENDGEHEAELREHLAAFRAGRPWREPDPES